MQRGALSLLSVGKAEVKYFIVCLVMFVFCHLVFSFTHLSENYTFLLLLAYFQAFLAPGALLLSFIGKRRLQWNEIVVVIMAFSSVFSCMLVYAFVFLGIYNQKVLLNFIFLEVALLLTALLLRVKQDMSERIKKTISRGAEASLFILFFTILIYVLCIVYYFDHPFGWDGLVSWNRWAVDFAKNITPQNTYGYTQLGPSLWSLVYVLTGKLDIEFTAKLTNVFFPFVLLFSFPSLFTRRPVLACSVLTGSMCIISSIGVVTAFNGYMDIPASVTSLAMYIFFFLALEEVHKNDESIAYSYIATLLGMLSFGLKMFSFLPALCMLAIFYKSKLWDRKKVLFGAFTVLAFFLFIQANYFWVSHFGTGNLEDLATAHRLHAGRSILERMTYSLSLLSKSFGDIAGYFLLSGLILFAFMRKKNIILALIPVVYFLQWAIIASYDIRNGIAFSLTSFFFVSYCTISMGYGALSRVYILKKYILERAHIFTNIACILIFTLPFLLGDISAGYKQENLYRAQKTLEDAKAPSAVIEYLNGVAKKSNSRLYLVTDFQPIKYSTRLDKNKIIYFLLHGSNLNGGRLMQLSKENNRVFMYSHHRKLSDNDIPVSQFLLSLPNYSCVEIAGFTIAIPDSLKIANLSD